MRLLVENPHLTDIDRSGEIVSFLGGGHDTIGYTLATALTLLAQHPNVAQKLSTALKESEHDYMEDRSKQHHQDCYAAWRKCDYLHYVIHETFRLYPVAAMGGVPRTLDHDLPVKVETRKPPVATVPKETETTASPLSNNRTSEPTMYIIPKGSMILMPQLLIHRNPKVFSNPNTFHPDRWATATTEMNQGLLPFYVGTRNCIGQSLATAEIQSVLPRLCRHYKFTIHQNQNGKPAFFLTLKIAGCRLSVTRIEDEEEEE